VVADQGKIQAGRLEKAMDEIGKVEDDPGDARRLVLTFHNQSESGLLMAGFASLRNLSSTSTILI